MIKSTFELVVAVLYSNFEEIKARIKLSIYSIIILTYDTYIFIFQNINIASTARVLPTSIIMKAGTLLQFLKTSKQLDD